MHPKGRIRAPPNANASQRLAKRGRARARLYGPVRARMRPCGPVHARERLEQGRGQVSPLNGSGVQDRFSHIRIKLGTGAVQENSGPNALAMAKPEDGPHGNELIRVHSRDKGIISRWQEGHGQDRPGLKERTFPEIARARARSMAHQLVRGSTPALRTRGHAGADAGAGASAGAGEGAGAGAGADAGAGAGAGAGARPCDSRFWRSSNDSRFRGSRDSRFGGSAKIARAARRFTFFRIHVFSD